MSCFTYDVSCVTMCDNFYWRLLCVCFSETTTTPTTFTTESQTTASTPVITTGTTASVSTVSTATSTPFTTPTISTVSTVTTTPPVVTTGACDHLYVLFQLLICVTSTYIAVLLEVPSQQNYAFR